MKLVRLARLVLSCALLFANSACVIHSEGGFAFAQGKELAERNETLPLELAAGETLRVELLYGDISVRVAEGEAPHVDAHWHANAEDKKTAEAVLARYKLELLRAPGSLSVRSVGEALEVKSGLGTNRLAAGVDLTLVVPGKVRLEARTSSGDLSAAGALAFCKLDSSYGDLAARGIRGDTALATSSGAVEVEDIEASSLEVESQYGDLRANHVQAATLRLTPSSGSVSARDLTGDLIVKSSYGDLSIDGSRGAVDAATSSGDIAFSSQSSAKRKLVTSYGDISASVGGGELEARTSSGDVKIECSDGSVNAESNYGDVSIRGRLSRVQAATSSGSMSVQATAGSAASAPWQIFTNYGDVALGLPGDFNCELSASAKSGEIASDFAGESDKRHTTLKCTLGTGGNAVDVKSGSGDVSIKRGAGSDRKI